MVHGIRKKSTMKSLKYVDQLYGQDGSLTDVLYRGTPRSSDYFMKPVTKTGENDYLAQPNEISHRLQTQGKKKDTNRHTMKQLVKTRMKT